jgi:hypothetical protein
LVSQDIYNVKIKEEGGEEERRGKGVRCETINSGVLIFSSWGLRVRTTAIHS